MKLCILSDASSLHIIEWAQFFARKGHEVSIISDNPAEIEGLNNYSIPKYEGKFHLPFISSIYQVTRKTIAIRRLINEIQPDILHSHYANIYGYLASLTGFHPHILTCHGSDLLVHPQRSKIEKYFVKQALRKADHITLPSEEMYQTAVSYSADAKKITVIQYGIDIGFFKYLYKNKQPARFLCTRMLTSQYHTDLIIRAFSKLSARYPEVKLDIVGDGPERAKLQNLVVSKTMTDQVAFWGKISHSEIGSFYEQASFYVTASPTDGLSISLLEAFATGVYPILPDNQSNRSLADLGFNLRLYDWNSEDDLANSMQDVLRNSDELHKKCLDNRKLVEEKFDRSKNLTLIETLYSKMINVT